ncbi:MAG: neutral/alkaline non-lysosomal ceramidase N-terminal domain-containing protein [Armatimonadota bacterium]
MGQLRAAADRVDLCPTAGVWLCGFSARTEPSTGEHDPICAQGVLLDDGVSRVAIISCDFLGFTSAQCWEMRARIASRCTIPAQNIIICSTHTHSGPASSATRGVMGQTDEIWLTRAFASIVNMVVGLENQLAPAQIAFGSATVEGIGYNRDDNSRPIDTELMSIALDTLDGQPIATLLNYATHAVTMGPTNLLFSGDFPAAAAGAVASARGGVGLYLQGACGDVDPVVYRDRGWGTGSFEDCRQMGTTLAEHAVSSLQNASWSRDVELHMAVGVVELPLDPPFPPEEVNRLVAEWEADVNRGEGESAIPKPLGSADLFLSWAGDMLDSAARGMVPTTFKAEITALSINGFKLIAVPFESYNDIATRVKTALGPGKTAFVGYANGEHGYLPSRWAKERGGYGADTSCRCFTGLLTAFGLGADELLVEKSVALAKSLEKA